MRIRAGVVLIQDNRVALIERYRAGLHYYVFPGGGVDQDESPEKAAIREAMEELGIEVAVEKKVAEVRFGQKSRQLYFLVKQTGGEFGTGQGEEFDESNPDNPQKGIYIPIWMSIDELLFHQEVHPAGVAQLVVPSVKEGWSHSPILVIEQSK